MSKNNIINICDRIIEYCFYLLLIVVTFSISIVEIASTIMIIAWITRRFLGRDWKIADSLPARILLAYFLWSVLSCVNSAYSRESLHGVFKVMQYSMVFIVAATTLWRQVFVKRSLWVMLGGTFVVCVNGLWQYFTGTGLIRHRMLITGDYMRRVSSSFIHPNDFGVYLLVVMLVFISFVLARNVRLRQRVVVAAVTVLSMAVFFLTRSRGAWLSFSAAFLVLGAAKGRRFLAACVLILLIGFLLLPASSRERVLDVTDFKQGTTAWERVMLWKGTVNMIKEHPVLGFGVNTYSRNFARYRPENYPDVRYAHNCYLHMASEIGIVGAVIFLGFLGSVIFLSFRRMMIMPPGEKRALSAGFLAGVIGFSLNCIVDTHLYALNPAVFFYLMSGFCFALTGHTHEK